ncbi:MAG TPA: acylneuraminate cytidylyltransferase family protein [Anaerolineales bacterium]|nr:acylneuraminate cytidylyltransferase family protein [Anaerolineales bacterium]
MTKIAALVPMRHHSQRVPGKNYRTLAGRPLFHHILESLLKVPEIAEICVDTDSAIVVEGLREHYPGIRVIQRPEHLTADDVSMNAILEYDVEQVKADYYLQTHTTNPLLRFSTISDAIGVFLKNRSMYDSLFSVTRWQTRLYDEAGRALNHDPSGLLQTQDLSPIFEENSCLYLFSSTNLIRRHHRIGDRPYLFEIDAAEAWDIDDELDFAICDFLIARTESAARQIP